MRRRLAGIILFGALAAAAACGEPTDPATPTPLGLLSVLTRSNADGQYVARPEGAFVYTTSGSPGDSRSTLDTCLLAEYDPILQSPEQLDAGDSIIFTAGSGTTLLRPDNSFGIIRYIANPLIQPPGRRSASRFTALSVAFRRGDWPGRAAGHLDLTSIRLSVRD
jgi:hypothetical protein